MGTEVTPSSIGDYVLKLIHDVNFWVHEPGPLILSPPLWWTLESVQKLLRANHGISINPSLGKTAPGCYLSLSSRSHPSLTVSCPFIPPEHHTFVLKHIDSFLNCDVSGWPGVKDTELGMLCCCPGLRFWRFPIQLIDWQAGLVCFLLWPLSSFGIWGPFACMAFMEQKGQVLPQRQIEIIVITHA